MFFWKPSNPAGSTIRRHRQHTILIAWLVLSCLPLCSMVIHSWSISKMIVSSPMIDLPSVEEPPVNNDNATSSSPKNIPNITRDHPHAGARSADGQLGYVADPTAVRKGRQRFLLQHFSSSLDPNQAYWAALEGYQVQYRNGTLYGEDILSDEYICAFGPGRGMEEEGGFKILTEKIQIYNSSTSTSKPPIKILCCIYTYSKMRDLVRAQALTWGYKCDGFLAFSTETIEALGALDLLHQGKEEYNNMWQKVRSIWAYIYDHYLEDFDFFHLGGDDLFLIVENLRHFLQTVHDRTPPGEPIYLGQRRDQPGKQPYFLTGAPGYTMNRATLKRFGEENLDTCQVNVVKSYEDRLVSKCLGDIGIIGGDTREYETGEQLYHDCSPHHLYTFRSGLGRTSFHSKSAYHWEQLLHPNQEKFPNQTVGPRHELQAAAKYSVALHDMYRPTIVARIYSVLYKDTCPADSPLGRGLRAHATL